MIMRKLRVLFTFIGLFAVLAPAYSATIQIKKAAPVASDKSSSKDSSASLVPTAIGLVSGVITLNQQQNALTADCVPTTTEINFVDNSMKAWAKTGHMTADEAVAAIGLQRCDSANGYAARMQIKAEGIPACLNYFNESSDAKMVWSMFPKVGKAEICKTGSVCVDAKDKQTVSDIYEIFSIIGFNESDYLPSEVTTASKLMEKFERCAPSKLTAKKRALWGNFLVNTASSLGQKQDTSNIMESVGQMVGSGGGISSLAGVATQLMQQ